jgi:hypothetical protein
VKLSYTNEDQFWILTEDDNVYFAISASPVPNSTSIMTEVKQKFDATLSFPFFHQKRLVERKAGVTFNFLPLSRKVLQFSLTHLMGALTASLVLFGVASSIVDTLMLSPRLCTWRTKLYRSMKYVKSKDFSDLDDARVLGELGEKVNPRVSHSVSVAAVGLGRNTREHDEHQFEQANALALSMIQLSGKGRAPGPGAAAPGMQSARKKPSI